MRLNGKVAIVTGATFVTANVTNAGDMKTVVDTAVSGP